MSLSTTRKSTSKVKYKSNGHRPSTLQYMTRFWLSVSVVFFSAASSAEDRGGKLGFQSATVDMMAYLEQHSVTDDVDGPHPGVDKYNRLQHFGAWQYQNSNTRCSQTRIAVLVRQADPRGPIEQNPKTCRVTTGVWHEPYTGQDVFDATELQIDHVVPLKNAYYLGGYRWRAALRCHYANYMGNLFHLLAVNGHENMAKGDRSPERYMPPSTAFHCTYLNIWMKIKTIWDLAVTVPEINSIEQQFAQNNCPTYMRYIAGDELAEQRTIASTPIESCENFEKSANSSTPTGPTQGQQSLF